TNVITALASNVTYYFAVTAYNTDGMESDFSNEVQYMADGLKPTVRISSPAANSQLTNATATLQGTATDNKAVAQVLCQLGGGSFQAASGTTNWTASVALSPGVNTIAVKSVDAAGKESDQVSTTMTCVIC